MNLESYIEKWNLRELRALESTATAKLFRCRQKGAPDRELVLKLFSEIGSLDEGNGSYFLLKNSNICTELINYTPEAQLLAFVEGENLYQFSRQAREAHATEIFIDLINLLERGLTEEEAKLTRVSDLFGVLETTSIPTEYQEEVKIGLSLSKSLQQQSKAEMLLHGDLHHENIIGTKEGGFKVIDPKALVGEVEYELATVLKNPWGYSEVSHCAQSFERRLKELCLGLKLDQSKVAAYCYVHLCLSICWAINSGSCPEHQHSVLKLAKKYI